MSCTEIRKLPEVYGPLLRPSPAGKGRGSPIVALKKQQATPRRWSIGEAFVGNFFSREGPPPQRRSSRGEQAELDETFGLIASLDREIGKLPPPELPNASPPTIKIISDAVNELYALVVEGRDTLLSRNPKNGKDYDDMVKMLGAYRASLRTEEVGIRPPRAGRMLEINGLESVERYLKLNNSRQLYYARKGTEKLEVGFERTRKVGGHLIHDQGFVTSSRKGDRNVEKVVRRDSELTVLVDVVYELSDQKAEELADNERVMLELFFFKERGVAHPHRVLREKSEERNIQALLMDWYDLGNLEEVMNKFSLTARELLAVARDLIEGVNSAHKLGIIHSNITPRNILLETISWRAEEIRNGISAALTDFRLAYQDPKKYRDREDRQWMAPEQLRKNVEQMGTGSDIWALGNILYLLCYNKPPPWVALYNSFDPPLVSTVLESMEKGWPEPLSGTLEHLAWRMLKYDPIDRINAPQAVEIIKTICHCAEVI